MSEETQEPPRRPSTCEICGETDTLPKTHVLLGSQLNEQTGDAEMVFQTRHFLCCMKVGCPDGSCPQALAEWEARQAAAS